MTESNTQIDYKVTDTISRICKQSKEVFKLAHEFEVATALNSIAGTDNKALRLRVTPHKGYELPITCSIHNTDGDELAVFPIRDAPVCILEELRDRLGIQTVRIVEKEHIDIPISRLIAKKKEE